MKTKNLFTLIIAVSIIFMYSCNPNSAKTADEMRNKETAKKIKANFLLIGLRGIIISVKTK